eukprot:899934_1
MASFYEAKRFFLVCCFITVLFALQPRFQPEDGELIQFQLDRFLSHKQLEFHLSGDYYKVQLVANHDLIRDESTPTCHYFGYVLEPIEYKNSSNLALSLCPNRGIRGSITTHDKTLSIMPSPSSSNNHQFTDDHLVYEQLISRTPPEHLSRHLLGSRDYHKIEVHVLSDPMYTKTYKDKYGSQWKTQLKNGIKDIMNQASAEYEWWDWGSLSRKISLHMTTLEIANDFTGIYTNLRPPFVKNKGTGSTCHSSQHWSNMDCRVDSHNLLPRFRTFHKENDRYGDTHLLLSGLKMQRVAGTAYTGVVCTSGSSAIAATPVYNWRIRTIAHEIGHNLGLNHDPGAIGVMGQWPDREKLRREKGEQCDPITGACVIDARKMGWGKQSEKELKAYFARRNDLSCAKDGVRSFRTIEQPSGGGSSNSGSSSSNSGCIEIRSLSGYNGEWKADGSKNGKRKYRNPKSHGYKWLYWTGKYWTFNDNYNTRVNGDQYCAKSNIKDCRGQWRSYGYRAKNSKFADCGGFTTDEEGLECLGGNEYGGNVCVYDDTDGYKGFTVADVCYNDKPVYEYGLDDDISYHLYADSYYEYFGNHSTKSVSQWIISAHDVAADVVATCDQSDLLQCLSGEWQVVYKDNDTIAMIVDEKMNVQKGKCDASALRSTSSSTTAIVWICIALAFVLLLSILALFIYRRSKVAKQSKQVAIGDESEEEEIEEEAMEVEVDIKLTETR